MEKEPRSEPSIVDNPPVELVPESSSEHLKHRSGGAAAPTNDFAVKSVIELETPLDTSLDTKASLALFQADHSAAAPHLIDYPDGIDQHDWDDLDKPFVLYVDRRQAIDKMSKRFKFIVLPSVAVYFLILIALHSWMAIFFFSIYTAGIYLFMVRNLNKLVKPLLVADKAGIRIDMLFTHCLVTWDNLKQIEPYTLAYRLIGINPKSIEKVQANFGVKVFLFESGFVAGFYRLIGQKCFVINIPEQYCHFSAEEVTEQIEKRREHFLANRLS